jgi:hypothetical protein
MFSIGSKIREGGHRSPKMGAFQKLSQFSIFLNLSTDPGLMSRLINSSYS